MRVHAARHAKRNYERSIQEAMVESDWVSCPVSPHPPLKGAESKNSTRLASIDL